MARRLLVIGAPLASSLGSVAALTAKRLGGEIISGNLLAAYAALPITAHAPPESLQRDVPHHLVGGLPLTDALTSARFTVAARALSEEVLARGRVPIIVGHSPFYLRHFIESFADPGATAGADNALQVICDCRRGSISQVCELIVCLLTFVN